MTTTAINDSREVRITNLPPDSVSWTPAGRVPITCHTTTITYDIPTRRLTSVSVIGRLRDEADVRRRARGFVHKLADARRDPIQRRYLVSWKTGEANLPEWLAFFVDVHRPYTPDDEL